MTRRLSRTKTVAYPQGSKPSPGFATKTRGFESSAGAYCERTSIGQNLLMRRFSGAMPKRDAAEHVHAISDLLGYEKKVSAQQWALLPAPHEIREKQTDCEKTSEALSGIWKDKDEPAFSAVFESARKMRCKNSACPLDDRR